MKLDGKVVLITGAASGIGRASAILFAKEGARVSVVDVDSSGGQETVKMIKQNGGVAEFISTDVSKASDVEQAIRTTVDTYGRLDIVFNNAGIVHALIPMEETDEELWDKVLAVNLKGVFLSCKYSVPIMKKQGGGVIINTASTAATHPLPCNTDYASSKAGVITFTKDLALELAPHNIRVNCVSPGGIHTPIYDSLPDSEGVIKFFEGITPLGRMGKPEEIAYAALYLASDEASFTTGINLVVDGGLTAGLKV